LVETQIVRNLENFSERERNAKKILLDSLPLPRNRKKTKIFHLTMTLMIIFTPRQK